MLALSIFPLVFSLGITFTNVNLFRRVPLRFIGLQNWERILSDEALRVTLLNTMIFVGGGVALQYVFGLALAVALNRGLREQRLMRILFLLPMMVSPIAVGFIIGRMVFSEGFGPVNDILQAVGLPAVAWVTSPTMAKVTIILVDTWQWTPLVMLLILAGLQGIPSEPLEAARADGASEWQIFRFIVFPLLLPISVTAILIRALEAFKIIDIIRVVTGGGPGRATESVTAYVYNIGAKQGDLAYAASAAYVLLFVVIAVSFAALYISRRVSEPYT